MTNEKANKLAVIFFSTVSILALEDHLYNFYFQLSLIGFFTLGFLSFKSRVYPPKGWYWFFILGFSCSCLVFSVINYNSLVFTKSLFIILVCYICYLLIKENIDILRSLIAIGVIISILTLSLQVSGESFLFWDLKFLRNASIFFDPNYASAIFCLLGVSSLIIINRLYVKILLYFLFFLCVFFTYSKAGVIAFLLGTICYIYCRYGYKFLFYIVVFIFIFYFMELDLSMFRVEQGFNNRDIYFELTKDYIFNKSNYFGGGEDIIYYLIKNSGHYNSSTHNFYLDLVLACGVIPFFFLIPLLVSIIIIGSYKRSRLFPIFISSFALSNSISISIGGIGILSIIYTYSMISILITNDKVN
ncbi:hypothetical protein [Haemophilus parahaemolyticus]